MDVTDTSFELSIVLPALNEANSLEKLFWRSLALTNVSSGVIFTDRDNDNLRAYTVAAWVKPRSVAGSQVLVNRGAANQQFTLYFYSNRVRMLVQHQPDRSLSDFR